MSIYTLISNQLPRWNDFHNTNELQRVELSRPSQYRDIYYIIFDRYADRHILQQVYNYNNSQFYKELKKRGFYIADSSKSNYPRTSLSLASSLNMSYLSSISEKYDRTSQNYKPIAHMMEDYKVWRSLKSIGYTFIHLGSYYQFTNSNKYADINLHRILISEFYMVLFKKTLLYPVTCKLGIFGDAMHHAKISLNQFEKVKTIPKISLPTYSFIHFLLPHAPYSFDRNGTILPDVYAEDPGSKERYIEQLIFTNKKILEMVDSLIIHSEITPIIILQADEGPFPERAAYDFLGFDWNQANDQELKQKTGILNAYLFPGIGDSVFYQSITPVNSFRLLFNQYFMADLSIFPDSVFIISNEKFPYDYIDITDRVVNNKLSH